MFAALPDGFKIREGANTFRVRTTFLLICLHQFVSTSISRAALQVAQRHYRALCLCFETSQFATFVVSILCLSTRSSLVRSRLCRASPNNLGFKVGFDSIRRCFVCSLRPSASGDLNKLEAHELLLGRWALFDSSFNFMLLPCQWFSFSLCSRPPGTFLVRFSSGRPGSLALSFVMGDGDVRVACLFWFLLVTPLTASIMASSVLGAARARVEHGDRGGRRRVDGLVLHRRRICQGALCHRQRARRSLSQARRALDALQLRPD